jgi:hypothetical protein
MKKLLVVTFLCLSIGQLSARTGGPLGLGVILGDPTGISAKLWTGKAIALDGAVGWNLERYLHLHAGMLWHNYGLLRVAQGELPLYLGLGGRLFLHETEGQEKDQSHLGIRGVAGLEYLFAHIPLDLFAEIAPVFDLIPGTELGIEGGAGLRFFF